MPAEAGRFLAEVRRHEVAVADSNVLIYHLEALEPYVELTKALLTALGSGEIRCIISALTVAEVMAGPHRSAKQELIEQARGFLRNLPNTVVAPVDFDVADEAARFRIQGLGMPDALVMATAVVHGAGLVITNDRALAQASKSRAKPRIALLDDFCS